MSAEQSYDRTFMRRAPDLRIRPETEADARFLTALFADCSPLANVLPPQLLALQAEAQQASHCQQHPAAMRRIVMRGGAPIGRFVVDWSLPGVAHAVDLAVLQCARHTLAGPHLLKAWLEVADASGRRCTLEVLADNRARLLYRRLGFDLDPAQDSGAAVLFMTRAVKS